MSPEMLEHLVPSPATDMQRVATAFALVAKLVKLSGRQRVRAECELRYRLFQPEPNSAARRVKMAPRAERRARIEELREEAKLRTPEMNRHTIRGNLFFRPVYGHNLPAPDHKEVIKALKWGYLHPGKPKAGLADIPVRETAYDAVVAEPNDPS